MTHDLRYDGKGGMVCSCGARFVAGWHHSVPVRTRLSVMAEGRAWKHAREARKAEREKNSR
jgi:hypothetical protein